MHPPTDFPKIFCFFLTFFQYVYTSMDLSYLLFQINLKKDLNICEYFVKEKYNFIHKNYITK
jgi:hypothetical protein